MEEFSLISKLMKCTIFHFIFIHVAKKKQLACQNCFNEACTVVEYFENEELNMRETVSDRTDF